MDELGFDCEFVDNGNIVFTDKKESSRAVNLIEIPDEKRVEVLTILLQNGNFRSLNKNTFEIENNVEEVIKKIRDKGIDVKRV